MLDWTLVHAVLRWSHIASGSLGLVAFWVPVFARKGSRTHILFGRLFVLCAYLVVATALVSCLWALADPRSFIGPAAGAMSESELAEVSAVIRFFFSLLGVLGLLVLTAIRTGVRVLRTRHAPERMGSSAHRGLLYATAGSSLALAVFGLYQLVAGGGQAQYVIALLLGLAGVHEIRKELRFLADPRPTPRAWWYKHMESMLGAGVAFHTAFLVFGFSRLVGPLPAPLALVPWLLPAVIGIPATSLWINYYRRRFGELSSPASEPAVTEERLKEEG